MPDVPENIRATLELLHGIREKARCAEDALLEWKEPGDKAIRAQRKEVYDALSIAADPKKVMAILKARDADAALCTLRAKVFTAFLKHHGSIEIKPSKQERPLAGQTGGGVSPKSCDMASYTPPSGAIHSPEPWTVVETEEGSECYVGVDANGKWLESDPYDGVETDDWNRIVAYSRAMAGVPDPEKLMAAVREMVDAFNADGCVLSGLIHAVATALKGGGQ